jgi:hypothetical protein
VGALTCFGGVRLNVDGLSSAHHGAKRIAAQGVRSFRDKSSEYSKEQGVRGVGGGGGHGLLLWKL